MYVIARATESLHLCVHTHSRLWIIILLSNRWTERNFNNNYVSFSFFTDVGYAPALAVDPGAGKLYFSIYHDGKIDVANLDGSGRETFVDHGTSSEAVGLALDLTDG